MASFDSLALHPALVQTLEDEGFTRPTALQEAMIPVARRGGNFVAVGSSGAGKTLAYGLAVLDRIAAGEGEGPRVLVVRLTPEGAARTADALSPFALSVGATLTSPGRGWRPAVEEADVVVSTLAEVLRGVSTSQFRPGEFGVLVVDGVDVASAEAVDSLFDMASSEAQRLVAVPRVEAELERVLERRVKRAIRFPPQTIGEPDQPGPPEGEIRYVVIEEAARRDALPRLLDHVDGTPALFLRTAEQVDTVSEWLSRRGYVVGASGEGDVDAFVPEGPDDVPEGAPTISLDVPADEAELLERHASGGEATVVIAPRERSHLVEIARRARRALRAVPVAVESEPGDELALYRTRVRTALRQEDLGAQLALLEPLLDEAGAAEVAAALSALLRRKPLVEPEAGATPAERSSQAEAADTARKPAAWARLFVSLGNRDGARPGDLVGAIAGEADIEGAKVGKIQIRDTFSIVEVHADVADRVIRALNGTTVKGRSLRVDYDRGGQRPERPERRPPTPRTGRRLRRPDGGERGSP